MSIARILALAGRIIRQILRDRRTLALIFIVPLLVMTVLNLVLNSTSSTPTLAIVRPTGAGSEQVNTLLNTLLPATSQLKTIDITADQVDSTLINGNADAALIFPDDFMQQLATGQHPTIAIKLEGSDPLIASTLKDQLQGLGKQLAIALSTAQQSSGHPQQSAYPPLNTALLFTTATPQYIYGGPDYTTTDSLAPAFIGLFSFFFIFLLTSVAFLRERAQGTIERIIISPLTRTELVLGYVCGFTIFALIQSLVILLFVIYGLHIHYSGNLALIFLVTIILAIGSVNLGIFLSTFAQNEFQIIQFIPLVFGIQIFLSGILWPLKQLPNFLQPISYILPLTYANDALRAVMLKHADIGTISTDITALLLFVVVMIVLSALVIRRQVS